MKIPIENVQIGDVVNGYEGQTVEVDKHGTHVA